MSLSQNGSDTVDLSADIRTADEKRMGDSLIFKTLRCLKSITIYAVIGTALAACNQTSEPVSGPLSGEFEGKSGTAVLQNINSLGLKCWIKSGDKEFQGFALIPELDTRSGSPRILIVKKGKGQGLPQMVIEANGSPVKVQTYGPLTQSKLSGRINSDIIAWNTGRKSCEA